MHREQTYRIGTLLVVAGLLAATACSGDAGGTGTEPLASFSSQNGGNNGPGDTSVVSPGGREWRLQTIRGVVLGLDGLRSPSAGDTLRYTTTPVSGAKVEIHKMDLSRRSPSQTDTTFTYKDLGVVATLATDANGKFEYTMGEPIVVKDGQPSPTITYQMTITPPTDSPYRAQTGVQVFFMEQAPTRSVWEYYLFRPHT